MVYKFKEKQTVTAGNVPYSISEETEDMTVEEREKIFSFLAKNPPKTFSPFTFPGFEPLTEEERERRKTEIITPENVYTKAFQVTQTALNTIYQKSGLQFIRDLLIDTYELQTKLETINGYKYIPVPVSGHGGEDLVNDVAVVLLGFIGNNLITETDVKKTKGKNKGKYKTVRDICFDVVNKNVGMQRKEGKTTVYLTEYESDNVTLDDEGNVIDGDFSEKDFYIRGYGDFSSKNEMETIKAGISDLGVTDTEITRIWLRMKGKTVTEIAKIQGCSHVAVLRSLEKIRRRMSEKYGVSYEDLKKRLQALENKEETEHGIFMECISNNHEWIYKR